jgi:GNAT superfamily N-acetyltransferase
MPHPAGDHCGLTQAAMTIRDPTPADETGWRNLWSQYSAFYEMTIPEAVTARTWQRMLDSSSAIFGRLAIADDEVIGFSVSVLHEGTWTIAPICYLEDLFVALRFRGQGFGRLLIADLVARAETNRWSRLYWHTRASNPARRLYDEFANADDFVRYRRLFPEIS